MGGVIFRDKFGKSDPVQISQIRHGKSPPSQPALIVSDPVQISQIRHGKSPLSQPALIVSDLVQISQIRHGKSTLSRPFSVMILAGNQLYELMMCGIFNKNKKIATHVI